MTTREIVSLDELGTELEAPQAGDTYLAKRAMHLEQPLTTDSLIDGRDVAADGALATSATQPADNISTLTNDAGYEANVALASQGEAEAGVENTKTMTALRVAQAIVILAAGLQNNLVGTVPPTTTDDDVSGYSIGSFWIDIVNDESYRCVDATTNLAVWVKTTLQTTDLATVALSADSDDLTEGVSNLLLTVAERAKITNITITQAVDLDDIEMKVNATTAFNAAVTAFATGGQANATQLNVGVSLITVVGTDGDSVKLPEAGENKRVILTNRTTNFADCFPSNGDIIGEYAVDVAISIPPNGVVSLLGIDNTTWIQI